MDLEWNAVSLFFLHSFFSFPTGANSALTEPTEWKIKVILWNNFVFVYNLDDIVTKIKCKYGNKDRLMFAPTINDDES